MRLVMILVLVLVVFIAVTVGVVTAARLVPAENRIVTLGLNLCEGIPCLLGIVPAQTLWTDAASRLTTYYSIKYEKEDSVIVGEHGDDRIFIYPASDLTVRRVTFTPYEAKPRTGDLMRQFGKPCNFLIETNNYVSLTYPHMQVYVGFVNGRVSIYSPVLTIILFHTDRTIHCYPEQWRAWVGFKHKYSYMRRWPRCLDCIGDAR